MELGLLLSQCLIVVANKMHQRARVSFLALHIVTLNMLNVLIASNPCARTGQCLQKIVKYDAGGRMHVQ